MKISLISILLGLAFTVPGSAQAGILDEAWKTDELNLNSINRFICKVMVSAGSDEQSNEGTEEEEEEPDCD
jgi:hypothetical protein